MQCFENELMRDYLFDLARELDPGVVRDELMLDDVLAGHGIASMAALLALGTDRMTGLVRELVAELPIAA